MFNPDYMDGYVRRLIIERETKDMPVVGMRYGRSFVDFGWVALLAIFAVCLVAYFGA